ncbi:IS3 family transposase [Clostridiisalibacter paucivorans]
MKELQNKIVQYICWYDNERIKAKLNGMSPIEYRQQAA